jgi:predicted DNA-binding antitoxin AbrB/MazE fold protein
MTTKVEAIYENGMLKLSSPLPLAEKARVVVTFQTKADSKADSKAADERQAWLKQSEEVLTKSWDNPDDDVFNELRDR